MACDWQGVGAALQRRTIVTVGSEEAVAISLRLLSSPEHVHMLHVDSGGIAALLHRNPALDGKVEVIPPAPDTELGRERRASTAAHVPLRILSVGTLSWTRGYEDALLATGLLAQHGMPCEYRIVGAGS